MKLPTLLLSSLLGCQALLAQGTLTFLNTPVGTGTPGGAPVIDAKTGLRLEGTGFWAQLYCSFTQNGTYTAIGVPVNFRTGTAAGFVGPTTVTVPGMAPGGYVWIQMRAWEHRVGPIEDPPPPINVGSSAPILVGPLGGPDPAGGPPYTAPTLIGLQPFSIMIPVPEPATWMLCAIGLGVLVARRHASHRTPPTPTV